MTEIDMLQQMTPGFIATRKSIECNRIDNTLSCRLFLSSFHRSSDVDYLLFSVILWHQPVGKWTPWKSHSKKRPPEIPREIISRELIVRGICRKCGHTGQVVRRFSVFPVPIKTRIVWSTPHYESGWSWTCIASLKLKVTTNKRTSIAFFVSPSVLSLYFRFSAHFFALLEETEATRETWDACTHVSGLLLERAKKCALKDCSVWRHQCGVSPTCCPLYRLTNFPRQNIPDGTVWPGVICRCQLLGQCLKVKAQVRASLYFKYLASLDGLWCTTSHLPIIYVPMKRHDYNHLCVVARPFLTYRHWLDT